MARFVYIQGTGKVDGVVLAALAEEKYTKQRAIEAKRGAIYDRNGNPIAEDTSSFTVVAILDEELTINEDDPKHVVDPEETASKLALLLKMDENEIYKILTKPDRKQVEFGTNGRDISTSLKQEIESLELPGIAFRRESKRYYPNGTFASHLVGYAAKVTDNETKKRIQSGRWGLKKTSINIFVKKMVI